MKFVFCEGKDDVAVIKGIVDVIPLAGLSVELFGGKNNLRNFLSVVGTRPEFSRGQVESMAIIRDADEDEKAAFQSVCEALIAHSFQAPTQNGGFTINGIKTGVFIVGPKSGSGMIEDLCLESVRDQKEFPCVDEYFRCIAEKSGRKEFSAKAKVRVWMGSQVDHDLYVGEAARKGYWPREHPAFNPLKEFLRQL